MHKNYQKEISSVIFSDHTITNIEFNAGILKSNSYIGEKLFRDLDKAKGIMRSLLYVIKQYSTKPKFPRKLMSDELQGSQKRIICSIYHIKTEYSTGY